MSSTPPPPCAWCKNWGKGSPNCDHINECHDDNDWERLNPVANWQWVRLVWFVNEVDSSGMHPNDKSHNIADKLRTMIANGYKPIVDNSPTLDKLERD